MKVLITGGTNGMGKGVAKILAQDSSVTELIILGRSPSMGEELFSELKSEGSKVKLNFILCDLTSLKDVKQAIEEVTAHYDSLDGLFVNAGIGYAAKRIETEDQMDPHFQVNYLSHFMLTLNLLPLLEKSSHGGRVIFNVTRGGEIFWDDMQMQQKWGYERGIHQAMTAKRMFLSQLQRIYQSSNRPKVSFVGFEISQVVWSNQLNIIPWYMRLGASLARIFGKFISIEKCGQIMSPLFVESHAQSLARSGAIITWKKNQFVPLQEEPHALDPKLQQRLWDCSLKLCADEETKNLSSRIL